MSADSGPACGPRQDMGCCPDKPDRVWQKMANPFAALGLDSDSDSEDGGAALPAVDSEDGSKKWGASFQAAAAAAAAVCPGGSVYMQQDVKGLSDADAAAPLSAAFVPCDGSTIIIERSLAAGEEVPLPPTSRFLVQSGFKPLVYAMALSLGLHADVERSIAAVGDIGFASDQLSEDGKAPNPLINTGALIVLELLSRTHSIDAVGAWCRGCSLGAATEAEAEAKSEDEGEGAEAGADVSPSPTPPPTLFDPEAVAATVADSGRNRRLCKMLQGVGLLPDTADALERAVTYYAALDCLLFTAAELATVAAEFAATAPSSSTEGAQALLNLSAADKQTVLDVMLQCGMYEASSTWGAAVGIPAKSGVSGVVWAVIPGVGGLCCHQPRIDEDGNGLQAMALIKGISALHRV